MSARRIACEYTRHVDSELKITCDQKETFGRTTPGPWRAHSNKQYFVASKPILYESSFDVKNWCGATGEVADRDITADITPKLPK